MQEFNKVTTTSNFIKNLLISTYLPLIRTVRDFDYIIEDRLYIYKCEIIKCTKSGYLVTGFKNTEFNGDRASYRVISEYYFGERNDKLCTNYISNSGGYDSLTHERLGKYLRSLRDMYDLNLMPLYNCFSNQILQVHHISNYGVERTSRDYNTKVYKVPIRFNTDYTICMDNLGATTFAPAFIKNNNLILLNNTRFGNGVDATNKYIKLHRTDVVQTKYNMRFKAPVVIRYNNIPETKKVTYFEKNIMALDYLHNDNYYVKLYEDALPREFYYIRNDGIYDLALDLTYEEFIANKTNYYYSNNGVITRCSTDSEFDSSKHYYTLKNNTTGHTYLVTDLTPETAGNTTLYIGVEPSTGRIDSTVDLDAKFFWREGKTLYTDIEIWEDENDSLFIDPDDVSDSYDDTNKTLELITEGSRLYDAPNFKTVCLWDRCSNHHKYNSSEVYYVRVNGIFSVWEYELGEEEFNKNKTFYYVKNADGQYIRCSAGDTYSSSTQYYVYMNGEYITTKEYYFIRHTTEFYLATGFKQNPEKYYILTNGEFIQLTGTAVFDMNSTYAIKPQRELFPWRVKDESGNLIPTADNHIVEGTVYYASYDQEIAKQYVYDITEENCALYDYLEDNLYLLIQVPKSYDSSIIILEGNYTNTQSEKILDDSEVERLPATLADYLYTSNLKLMEMQYSLQVPFSDTLIEFLLWNAINNLDSINNNMDRLLLAIERILDNKVNVNHFANYWYPQYRKLVSDIGRNYNNMVVSDNLGYVTKNLEQVINTSRNIDTYINEYPYGN